MAFQQILEVTRSGISLADFCTGINDNTSITPSPRMKYKDHSLT